MYNKIGGQATEKYKKCQKLIFDCGALLIEAICDSFQERKKNHGINRKRPRIRIALRDFQKTKESNSKIIANLRAHSNLRYDFLTPGVVPKPTSEMAKDGPHEEGPGTAGAQRASADLLGAAADPGREEAKRDPEEREENMEATRKAEEKTQGNRELQPLFRKDERKRNHH